MKKIVFSILVLIVTTSSLFASGIRCSSLGGISSLIDSKNISTFPQRTILHPEVFYAGSSLNTEYSLVYGGVRYHIFDNMAIQFNASQNNTKSLPEVTPSMEDFVTSGLNMFDVSYSYKFNSKMLFGASLKYYYNGTEYNTDGSSSTTTTNGSSTVTNSSSNTSDTNHSIWYLNFNPSMTFQIDDKTFVDGVINLGFGSFSGESKSSYNYQNGSVNSSGSTDHYEYGTTEADSWYNIGFEARYYSKDFMKDIDLVPYTAVNYTNYGIVTPDTLDEGSGFANFISSDDTDQSLSNLNFKLGSGIHWKISKTVTVFNEFEFNYSNRTELVERAASYADSLETGSLSESVELYSSSMTLFPTYRLGIESAHEFTENNWIKNYLFIDSLLFFLSKR